MDSKPAWNFIDKTISFVAPKWAAERLAYRNAFNLQSAYYSAFPNRVSTQWGQSESLNSMPHLNLQVARNLRDRARSLVENNQLASSILNQAVSNIVGNGFKCQAQTSNADWNAQADRLFNAWTHEADYHGRSWVQHQRITAFGLLRDGDTGAALLSKGQIQLVEGDYISSPYTQPEAWLHDGVELDKYGRVTKYWVMQFVDMKNRTWRPVPANHFIFVANKRRATQYRGETSFAQSFDLFDQLKGYLDAVVLAQKIAACLAVFVKTKNPAAGVQGLNTTKNVEGQQQRKWALEPGTVQTLLPDEEIDQITPSQPGNGFSENVRMLIRLLGLSFGMPLEYASLDFSGVSGATAKASAQAAQRAFESIQRLLIDEYYCPIWRWKIQQFIDEGLLEDIPDKFAHRWHAEPWPYLDKVKEIQAMMLEVDAGLTTETAQLISMGKDPDKVRIERGTELETKRQLKIPIYHTSMVQEIGTKVKDSDDENDGTKETGAPDANSITAIGANGEPT